MRGIDSDWPDDSNTKLERAITSFTNRYEAIRTFASYLNDDPPIQRVLFFHGDGGNGKSLLLRFLRERCLRRLRIDDWVDAKATRDENFVERLHKAEDAFLVPYAHLDFGMRPQGHIQPQDDFSALSMLRRWLAQYHISFPLFDYACVLYLYKFNQGEKVKTLLPPEAQDIVSAIVDTITGTTLGSLSKPVISSIVKHFDQHHGINEKLEPV